MGTLVDLVAEQTGLSYDETIQYMDGLESINAIERVAPCAPWELGAWATNDKGERVQFWGPLHD